MRLLSFLSVFVFGLLFSTAGQAQNVPLEKVDSDTYTFSTKEMVLITDFMIDGPTYHITDDPYQFKLVALTKDLKTDTTVNGFFPFVINRQQADVRFRNGEALVEINLGKAKEVHAQLANTTLEKKLEVTRMPGWPAIAGILIFLLLTWFFRHALAHAWHKITGSGQK